MVSGNEQLTDIETGCGQTRSPDTGGLMMEKQKIIETKRRPAQRLKQSVPFYPMLLPGMVLLFFSITFPCMDGRLPFRNSYRRRVYSGIRNGWGPIGSSI